tara:strand:- start:278 stop:946 length:669 start_codon:yes stop_codon:yes gene_type:complete
MTQKLSSELLINSYSNGIFPMSNSRFDKNIFFVKPKKRGIIPLDKMKISKSLFRLVNFRNYQITSNKKFEKVISSCASPIFGRKQTWINTEIKSSFLKLHNLNKAKSIEIWENSIMIGGIYGLTLGSVFFAESMFSAKSNASKIALVWLIAFLKKSNYKLFDTQFLTPHLSRLGGIEISHEKFSTLLSKNINKKNQFPEINSTHHSDWEIVFDFMQEMRETS